MKKAGNLRITKAALTTAILMILSSCGHLPDDEELISYKNATASQVLSEDNVLIGKFFFEDRTNVEFNSIPPQLINALIATEDVRFFEHRGNDPKSILRVLFKTILFNKRGSGGGSTITQQLAKNMFGRKSRGLFHVLINKTRELILARRLEKIFTKEEILTLYLNTVSFGENVYGIEAASSRFFGKRAEYLKTEESSVLIGMLKANTYYNPRLHPENARTRRNVVLSQMGKYGFLKPSVADSLSGLPLVINYTRSGQGGIADYFLINVRSELEKIVNEINSETGKKWDPEKDGLIIQTTLNLSLQKYAVQSFHEHLPKMQKKLEEQYKSPSGKNSLELITGRELKRLNLNGRAGEKRFQEIFNWNKTYADSISVADSLKNALVLLHAGLLAIDPLTGGIKTWVGGIDFKTQPYDQVLARRQMASVFKPVIYAAAVEDGMEPCQYLDNDSVKLSGFDDWSPENFDHSYGGKYSLAGALAQSMNIPTFSLFLRIGFEKVDSMWKRMGFSFPLANNPSLAMGTAEANIKEVAVAYSSFANGGYLIEPKSIVSIKSPDGQVIFRNDFSATGNRILDERTGLLMSAMLRKAVSEGTGASVSSVYGVNIPLGGKTGTSQNYADAWFAVFNPGIVMVSRVGASTAAIHFNNGSYGSGSALALPLVALTLKKVNGDRKLMEEFISDFPELPGELQYALDCPDFREKNFFDRFIDIFQPEEVTYDSRHDKIDRRLRSIFRKIFRK
jgi:penicillin-binding protein 1A